MAVVYHWKHGWIPLDHQAALQKAHGSHAGAAKLMADAPHATGIKSRQDVAKAALDLPNLPASHRADAHQQLREAAVTHNATDLLPAHLKIRPSTYRGESGHTVTGTDTHGRQVKVFTPGDRSAAEAVVANKKAGRNAFDTSPSATPWHPMTDGSQWRETPAGLIVQRGNRELHLLGTSVDAQQRAKHLIARHSFDKLFKHGRSAPGTKNVSYIKL